MFPNFNKLTLTEWSVTSSLAKAPQIYKLITDVRHGRWWENSSLQMKWLSGIRSDHHWITQAWKDFCSTLCVRTSSSMFHFWPDFEVPKPESRHFSTSIFRWCAAGTVWVARRIWIKAFIGSRDSEVCLTIKMEGKELGGDGCVVWPKRMHKRIWWIACDLEWDEEKQEDSWHRLWSSRVTDGGKETPDVDGEDRCFFFYLLCSLFAPQMKTS